MSISYQIKKSARRKSVAIKVSEGQVIVYAPTKVPVEFIVDLVAEKSSWIKEKLAMQQTLMCDSILSLERVTIIDVPLSLSFSVGENSLLHLAGDHINVVAGKRVKNYPQHYLHQLTEFINQRLLSYLQNRLTFYAKQMQTDFGKIKVRHYKRRWGSCDGKGNLTFNHQLAFAPSYVIDYVVVHELSHRFYMDHSRQFWQTVNAYYPNYKKAELWLKQHGHTLNKLKLAN